MNGLCEREMSLFIGIVSCFSSENCGGTQCFFDIMRKIFFFFVCGKWRCESSYERINFTFLKYAIYKGYIIGIKKGSRNHSGIGTK